MKHLDTLDLVDLSNDGLSDKGDHIMAVTETLVEKGDTFYIGKHPQPITPLSDISGKYQVDAVIDVVEVSFLNYRIRASKI